MRIYKIFLVLIIVNFVAFMFYASSDDYEPRDISFIEVIPTAIAFYIPNAILAGIARVVMWVFYCLCMMTIIRDSSIVGVDSVGGVDKR